MPSAARQLDSSTDGVLIVGSPNTFINSRMAVRLADVAQCAHGAAPLPLASSSVFINSRGAARLADPVPCPVAPGVVTSGSPNVRIGG